MKQKLYQVKPPILKFECGNTHDQKRQTSISTRKHTCPTCGSDLKSKIFQCRYCGKTYEADKKVQLSFSCEKKKCKDAMHKEMLQRRRLKQPPLSRDKNAWLPQGTIVEANKKLKQQEINQHKQASLKSWDCKRRGQCTLDADRNNREYLLCHECLKYESENLNINDFIESTDNVSGNIYSFVDHR